MSSSIHKPMEFFFPLRLALTLALIFITTARSVLSQDSPQDFLDIHNAARAEVGVEPLMWDDQVARYAQSYAYRRSFDCDLVHSGGPFGENIAMSTGDFSAVGAVEMWVAERSQYDPYSNTCTGGQCLHYTQVVWSGSTSLGCAKMRCNDGGTFITCNYNPPGNYRGQRPF